MDASSPSNAFICRSANSTLFNIRLAVRPHKGTHSTEALNRHSRSTAKPALHSRLPRPFQLRVSASMLVPTARERSQSYGRQTLIKGLQSIKCPPWRCVRVAKSKGAVRAVLSQNAGPDGFAGSAVGNEPGHAINELAVGK